MWESWNSFILPINWYQQFPDIFYATWQGDKDFVSGEYVVSLAPYYWGA